MSKQFLLWIRVSDGLTVTAIFTTINERPNDRRAYLTFWEVAERLGDGSRGLEPKEEWWGKRSRRGATLEPKSQSSPSTVAPRRPVFALSSRGLKPTATVMASLCEAEPPEPW